MATGWARAACPFRADALLPREGEDGYVRPVCPLRGQTTCEAGQVGACGRSALPRAVSQYITGVATRLSSVLVISPPMIAMASGE